MAHGAARLADASGYRNRTRSRCSAKTTTALCLCSVLVAMVYGEVIDQESLSPLATSILFKLSTKWLEGFRYGFCGDSVEANGFSVFLQSCSKPLAQVTSLSALLVLVVGALGGLS